MRRRISGTRTTDAGAEAHGITDWRPKVACHDDGREKKQTKEDGKRSRVGSVSTTASMKLLEQLQIINATSGARDRNI